MEIQSINNNYNSTNFNGVVLLRSRNMQTLEAALSKAEDFYRKSGVDCKRFFPSTTEKDLTEYSAMIFSKEHASKFFKKVVSSVKNGCLKIKDNVTGFISEEAIAKKDSARTNQIVDFVNGELKGSAVQELNASQIVNRQAEQMKWVLK